MKKFRSWLKKNDAILGVLISLGIFIFWIFNIYATGRDNEKHIVSNTNGIIINNNIITAERISIAEIQGKLDVLLIINNVDPKKVKFNNGYLFTERGYKEDTSDLKKYVQSLTIDNNYQKEKLNGVLVGVE